MDPRSSTDPFASGRFPLCSATHDQGLRWLFDLATVLLVLDCRPGDRVLDLGAGSGFSSEMLARFGYQVFALDPDRTALAHNRSRQHLDRRRIDGRVFAAAGVAEWLPIGDACVDGILGMNVLHHVPDLEAATREMSRVLRPGCRAVFCEPGLDHMHSPETQRAVQEHGETDRPFDVLRFLSDARGLGFKQAMLSATLQSALRLLPVEEVDLFRSGAHPRPHMTPAGVIDELHRRHAYAVIVKAGDRALTSRYPGVLRARVSVPTPPRELTRGVPTGVLVTVENMGDTRWLCRPSPVGGFVTVGCKLLDPAGRLVDDTIGRTCLTSDLAPGDATSLQLELTIPSTLDPGSYHVRVDLVNELVAWFSDYPGNTSVDLDVRVR